MTAATPTATRTLQRVVLPLSGDADVLPLYVEMGASSTGSVTSGEPTTVVARESQPQNVLDRRRLRVPAGSRASFASYFNAFPASYWRRWTVVESVELHLRVSGPGSVVIYRSTATGTTERVTSSPADAADTGPRDLSFPLPLTRFADGGWYWFDIVAGREDAVLEWAEWRVGSVSADGEDRLAAPAGTVTIGVTTFNQPTYLLDLLRQLGAAPDTLAIVDEVLVVDQGTKRVKAQPDVDEASAGLAGKLRILEQANVGGSGGFARSMKETLEAGRSRYVLLLDDDVASEPESILRGATFADLCRQPTIVGGHMFSLYARSSLHSLGEVVKPWRFWWDSHRNVVPDHDFSRAGLRDTHWLHRRIDVDYNGWWMCMIPVEVVKTVGLSLPFFIKWDDAEYGLRAGKAGFPTVSLPGMAIWHVPWTEKDDALDWQAYYHQRNRMVAALIHSPFGRGGRLVRESFNYQVKHLLAMQYSVADLRLRALEDVLSGPDHLHAGLATTLPAVRATRSSYPDAQNSTDVTAFPTPKRRKPLRKDREPEPPRGLPGMVKAAAIGAVRQLRPVKDDAQVRPQAAVPAMDAAWWRLSALDSAIVSTMDGTAAAWYRRDRGKFAALLKRSIEVHERLLAEWPALSARYRDAADALVSPETWGRTFADLQAAGAAQPAVTASPAAAGASSASTEAAGAQQ
jgi:galactofuranosylgalactofuranosylrhamnosyl-N-acetylglucosaminyl-diphospho-decaprenol beta-1,5/1,6-galactofuranosyltransferase